MDRQSRTASPRARTNDTVVVKCREDKYEPNAGGRRGKDDRKQNTLLPLLEILM